MSRPAVRGTSAVARTAPLAAPRRVPRPPLRLVRRRAGRPPRAPFVMLVLTLLAAGLVGLLMLNAAAVANSDRQRDLREDIAGLELREQQLQREVSAMEAPNALAEAARRLGMVPSGDPAFLILGPDGTYRVGGSPAPAQPPPPSAQAGGVR